MASTPRHEFYESDEKLMISIFDKGADREQVKIDFAARKLTYTHGDKRLVLEPLKAQIDPDASKFTVGKMKVEICLVKCVPGKWGSLIGDSPDPLASPTVIPPTPSVRAKQKNWDGITDTILSSEKERTMEDDPNTGGDVALNSFFQKLFEDADDDTKKAMMKSYQESGGTALSTNWEEVKKAPVGVRPPEGAEWKKWG